ncbi:LolA family protein [Flavihumibacter sp. UBA7668]|uniref:LolA family protein n=1 Tax=Flavihumibacter sp. UBA7668 TaxID=1946542 RepID=UPI0025C39BD9|nr:outer membrane lipoprotein carrier protein LolA [Flavihumibacter sp. UBA7668]
MRKIVFLLFIMAGFGVHAQHKGFSPVSDLVAFKTAFTQKAVLVNSIRCDFTQEKNLSLLEEKILSKGKFWFKKDNLVRMEYQHPFQYLMIINGKNIYIKDGQKENKVAVRSNKLFQKINQLTIDCVQGTVFSNPDFSVKAFENKQQYLVEMVPVTKEMKEFFSAILVRIDRKDYAVSSINMMEKGGDFTLISFQNKEINQVIPDALFQQK